MTDTNISISAANKYSGISVSHTPKRGEIYYVAGSEDQQELYGNHANRPMLIVSNDNLNACLASVTMVHLTSKEKRPMPNHVPIYTGLSATALCENLRQVPKARLGNFLRRCSDEEMEEIGQALTYVLDIGKGVDPYTYPEDREQDDIGVRATDPSEELAEIKSENLCLKTELAVCERLYNSLLDRITGAKGVRESD